MHDDLIISFCIAFYNRNKIERKDTYFLSSNEEVDYSEITDEDIQKYKEGYDKFEDEDISIDELMEERKKDKFTQRFGVSYNDYNWLLGLGCEDN